MSDEKKKDEPTANNPSVVGGSDTNDAAEKMDTADKVEKKEETELDKYWRAVRENPMDFTGWTYLLQYVEQEDNLPAAREAYNAFFACYPYCYGYWKKYADMEKRHNDLNRTKEVFEKGTKAIPLSVELWLHYLNFVMTELSAGEKGEEEVRKLYERAVTAVGKDFRSDKLWDSYISWEKDLKRKTLLYDRLLTVPIQLYSHHWDNAKAHVLKHHPKDILYLDEFLKLRAEVVKTMEPQAPGADDDDAPPPGEEVPPGMEEDITKSDNEEIMKLREKILETRETIFKKNEEEISKRWAYEEGIKRPYFHVKPLERSQLKNWREYLDFEIQVGDHERIVVLFERCMIATCLYEDFWMKYAKYLEEHSIDAVRNVYKRACTMHLQKKPYIHMAWAAFEERQGKHQEALQILDNLEKKVPGMVMVAMRRIGLERRVGNTERAEQLFQEYINSSTVKSVRAFYTIKYARYLFKILGEEERAKKVICEAIEKDESNTKLYIQLLDIEYQKRPVEIKSALEVFNKILNSDKFNVQTKLNFSQRRLEFLEDFGNSIMDLKECYDEHQKLLRDMHSSEKEKKRKNVDMTEDVRLEKKPRTTENGSGETQHADYSAYWAHYQNAGYGGYPGGAWPSYGPQYYT